MVWHTANRRWQTWRAVSADGINGSGNGPLSQPLGLWSPFYGRAAARLWPEPSLQSGGWCAGVGCSAVSATVSRFSRAVCRLSRRHARRRNRHIGRRIDQDDMIAFRASPSGAILARHRQCPAAQRADQVVVPCGQLRYVNARSRRSSTPRRQMSAMAYSAHSVVLIRALLLGALTLDFAHASRAQATAPAVVPAPVVQERYLLHVEVPKFSSMTSADAASLVVGRLEQASKSRRTRARGLVPD